MVCTKSVLIISIVDSNLDGDRRVDQSNDCGRDSNEVGVSSIRRTSESLTIVSKITEKLSRELTQRHQ